MACSHLILLALQLSLVMPTAPEPALAPVRWELKFRYQDPQRIAIDLPGHKEPLVYWFMLYTAENPVSRAESPEAAGFEFYPRFDLVTDTMKLVRDEHEVSAEAFKAIQRRAEDPLLTPPHKMAGLLQQGKDRARHGVAIWKDFDPKA